MTWQVCMGVLTVGVAVVLTTWMTLQGRMIIRRIARKHVKSARQLLQELRDE